jgi:hypothetical protein
VKRRKKDRFSPLTDRELKKKTAQREEEEKEEKEVVVHS